jgi:MFS family permease
MYFDKRPLIFRNFLHEILYVSVISCAQLLTQAALGNVVVPLHIIGPTIGIDDPASPRLPWTLAAYSLTVGIFIMITGRLGDIYGHKLLVIIGFGIFSTFSLLVGIAVFVKNDIYFDIMRAFQGIGPATLLPNAVALLARAYPNGKRKSFVFSMFGATAPTGFILGALFASIFAEFVWWPWAQWILAIFCAFLAIAAYFIIPVELSPAVHPTGKTDILGAVIGLASLTLFIYCWNQGPVTGWDKPYVYVLLIVSVLMIGVFLFVETKVKEPIMPLSIWTVAGFPGVLACIALGWSSFGIFIYYIVQFIEEIRGASPLLTTAMMSPIILSGLSATIVVSLLYGRVPAHFLLTASMCCFCIGNILVATAPPDQTYWAEIFVATLITPFGMDISFPAASLIVSNTIPEQQQGVAASMVNMAINWSISFGLGIAGTVQSQIIKNGKSNLPLDGYRSASYTGIGLSGLGIIVALVFCRVPAKPASNEHEKSPADVIPPIAASENGIDLHKINSNETDGTFPMTYRF